MSDIPFDFPGMDPFGDPNSPDSMDNIFPADTSSSLSSSMTSNMQEADWLQDLNPAQRAAVTHQDGPLLVLAGAGTGKTKVLTARIAHLIATDRCRPWQILAVTFTNKAAQEMRQRISQYLHSLPADQTAYLSPGWEKRCWIGTFHAIAARLLRQFASDIGLRSDFTILDSDDQLRLLKQICKDQNLDDKKWPAKTLRVIIERWKDRGYIPGTIPPEEKSDFANGKAEQLYDLYQTRLQNLNVVDFGDLLLHCLTLFRQKPDILAQLQQRWPFILVDEYQDTNICQYLWLRLLAQSHRNICCVGDDDQSIYGWRGAEVGHILKFDSDFPEAEIVRLEQNYRSTQPILTAASAVIAHNQGRLGKTLWTDKPGGSQLSLYSVMDGVAEAQDIANKISNLQQQGHLLRDIAILVRAGFQTRSFEERFLQIGLPYQVIGGLRFYERQEIRDVIAYFRLISQADDDLALERIINIPRRGIGATSLAQLHQIARANGTSLYRAAHLACNQTLLKPAATKKLKAFLDDLAEWQQFLPLPPADIAEQLLDATGYRAYWQAEYQKKKRPEIAGRLENLKELSSALAEFDTLTDFLEHISLVMDQAQENSQDQVTLMTLHAAKGLEFQTVFLPGWEEGLFPHQRAIDEAGLEGIEEERRLAYVALTRAKEKIYLYHAASRLMHGQYVNNLASRFLSEIPEDVVEHHNPFATSHTNMSGLSRNHWGTYGSVGQGEGRLGKGSFQDGYRSTPTASTPPNKQKTKQMTLATHDFAIHQRVFHQKFGYGEIADIEGEKISVVFEHSGPKKLMAGFLILAEEA